MKIQVEQNKLATLLGRVVSVVERRSTIPILSNVLLATDADTLTATATDLDVSIKSATEATVYQHGATTVSATLLSAIVSKMAKGSLITITAENGRTTVSNGKASFDLATLDVADFPEIANDTYQATFTAGARDLKRLFDMSAFCMATEELRYYLNGVYLHPIGGSVRAVSTDGHRLAQIDSEVAAEFPGVIVPRKTVAELRKLLDIGDVEVSASETKIRFDLGHTQITSKVIDGTFPDYTRVIPTADNHIVTADAKEMKQASDLVAVVSGERTKAVKLTVEGDTCTLQVRADGDVAEEAVKVQATGGDASVGFNARYLADALQQCGDSKVTLTFGDGMSAVKLESSDDDKALFVVMPTRI